MEKGSFVNFPELTQILVNNDAQNDLSFMFIIDIKGHLKSLSDSLDGYFPNLLVEQWIVDPFTFPIDHIDNENKLKDDLMELKTSGYLKMQFSTMPVFQSFGKATMRPSPISWQKRSK